MKPVLGPPVEPPEDVWATALAGAFDDPRDPGELTVLVPADSADLADPAGLGAGWVRMGAEGEPDDPAFDRIDEPAEDVDRTPAESLDAGDSPGIDALGIDTPGVDGQGIDGHGGDGLGGEAGNLGWSG